MSLSNSCVVFVFLTCFPFYETYIHESGNLYGLPIPRECIKGAICNLHCDNYCKLDDTGGECIGSEGLCYCDSQICSRKTCEKHCSQDLEFGKCIDKHTCSCNKTIFDAIKTPVPEDKKFARGNSDCRYNVYLMYKQPECINTPFCGVVCNSECYNREYPELVTGECIGNLCYCSDEECVPEICQIYCTKRLQQGTCQDNTCTCSEALFKLTGVPVPSPKTFFRPQIKCPM